MTETTTNILTFGVGDVIRIELTVQDDSGVAEVEARFRYTDSSYFRYILRPVKLDGGTIETPIIEIEVTDDLASGDYVCEYLSFTDNNGNSSLVASPGIEFRIEGTSAETGGPELAGWQFVSA